MLLGEPEVEQPDAGLGEHDVARLQVAVHDALPVRGVEGLGDLDRDGQRLGDGQGPALEALGDGLAVEELHDEEVHRRAVRRRRLAPHVEERADVRVVDGGDGARLALEALVLLGAVGDVGGQHLDGNGAVEAGVRRPIDLAHAAGAEGADHLVRPEPVARRECLHGGINPFDRSCGPRLYDES